MTWLHTKVFWVKFLNANWLPHRRVSVSVIQRSIDCEKALQNQINAKLINKEERLSE